MIDLLLKLFAMGSACVNPFLYGWLNDNFKKELGKMFGYKVTCCRPPGSSNANGALSMGYFSKTTAGHQTVYNAQNGKITLKMTDLNGEEEKLPT